MGLISEKDQKLIDHIRSSINLPDWSLAMSIRGRLELEDWDKRFYSDGEPMRCESKSPTPPTRNIYQCQHQNLHKGSHVYYGDNWKLIWW